MADSPEDDSDAGAGPGRGAPPRTPRWVKAFGSLLFVLLLLVVILHLTGRGLGGHMPFEHAPAGGRTAPAGGPR